MTTHPPAWRYDVSWSRRNTAAGLAACAVFGAALLAGHLSRPLAVGRELPLWGERISAVAERINPNTASAGSLQRLPGIGPLRAKSIVAYRQAHGPVAFRRPEDLANIRGIGPATVHNVALHLSFDSSDPQGDETAPASAPAATLNPPPGKS